MRRSVRHVRRDNDAIGVSTLRGQFADNAEWRNDPARPAIITGTVDMVGSRLLFSGLAAGSNRGRFMPGFWGRMRCGFTMRRTLSLRFKA